MSEPRHARVHKTSKARPLIPNPFQIKRNAIGANFPKSLTIKKRCRRGARANHPLTQLLPLVNRLGLLGPKHHRHNPREHQSKDSGYDFAAARHGVSFFQVFKAQSNKHIQKARQPLLRAAVGKNKKFTVAILFFALALETASVPYPIPGIATPLHWPPCHILRDRILLVSVEAWS